MSISLSAHQARLLRLRAQQFFPSPPASPSQVVGSVFAIQAQELPAALLSIRARSSSLTAAGVEHARQEERSLAWVWCLRGTLHLVTTDDARWLVPLLGPALIAGNRRRMTQLGWDESNAGEAIRRVRQAIEDQGPRTRAEITRLLQQHHLPFEGQATVHLLYRATLEGLLCSGPDRGNEHTYTLFETWLGAPQSLPREEALARLALRYLRAYAPATPQDFAAWAGIKPQEARSTWRAISDQLVEVQITEGQGQNLWMIETQRPWLDERPEPDPLVRLLPRYDTLWMGYANRDLLIDPAYTGRVNAGGGVIHPCLLVDGRVQGTWKTRRRAKSTDILLEPFEPLPGDLRLPIEQEIAEIQRFLGEKVRLPRP